MDDQLSRVGPRLRAARLGQGLTLEGLAERAGLSASTLSRLEAGKRQATLELLLPLTRQLGMSLDELVHPSTPDPRVRRPSFRRAGVVVEPLAPEGSSVHVYKMTHLPTREVPRPGVHPGFEWLYVLSGELRLQLGERDMTLGAGEAAEFDTLTPHAVTAAGTKPAVILSIFSRDGARFHTHEIGEEPDPDAEPLRSHA
ncbi:helix-turn-helix domain-containing protein [uncultured Kocuria sp.]|uniref:helix-turn-helix domain-containing protein n=1 Tax=uncultured Kocuria sp. TaxID=259305 RepID=UPI002594B500|nr:XRE family transcriptional regulator [uncultured Kocuria sp.]MCT1367810.1 XRE family transcriptional regulator [Rothia sp. p3-SID1597]